MIEGEEYLKALEKYLNAFGIGEEEEKEVLEVVRSKRLGADTGGNKTKTFEELVARYQGVDHAIAATSGTAALQLSMAALGVGPGDEVIVPAISSVATANAVVYQNAVPIFADLDPNTLNMEPDDLAKRTTKRTKAIIPVHMYGCPADIEPIMEIARKHDLFVIEDCCLAQGAEYSGRKVGTFGDIGCFSFGSGKQLYTGQGGMVTTDDEKIAEAVAKRNHHYGTPRDEWLIGQADVLGYNYKLPEIVSAIGIAQIRKLDTLNNKRIENAEYLTENLKTIEGIRLPYVPPNTKHVFNEYVIKVEEEVGMARDDFCRALRAEGIFADLLFTVPMYLEPSFQRKIGYGSHCPFECLLYDGSVNYSVGLCPTAEEVLRKVVAISPHPGLSKDDLDEIVSAIRSLLAWTLSW